MNKLKTITFLLFFSILVSCKNEKFIINEKGVLDLSVGETISDKLGNYKMVDSVEIVEDGIEEPIVKVFDKNEELFQIGFQYDIKQNNYNTIVNEIIISNKKFKTNKNIGVESTLSDFINSHPNYYIWYTYISNRFIIQSKDSKIQFILDNKSYKGNEDLLYENDSVELKKEDFLTNTRIVKVRIFQ
ncbi:hypothetical protein [Flavobacterium sp.]|jgi:hypothetical protein|uniref:hypothetical protein n=1 Tax=Flavobacterium sp. TaxID=239 RepID=UPI0037C10727